MSKLNGLSEEKRKTLMKQQEKEVISLMAKGFLENRLHCSKGIRACGS